MAITNLYPNLPGHLVEFKDGGLTLTSNNDVTGGKSLLILGTAFDGPVNEPVQIDSTTVSQLFGSDVDANGYPNGATLTKYAKQAFKNGFKDVRCMRVTGSQASAKIEKTSVTNTIEELKDETFVIKGNAKQIKRLSQPIYVDGTMAVYDTVGLQMQTGLAWKANMYVADVTINEGVTAAGSSIKVEYDYKDISLKNNAQPGIAVTTTVDFDTTMQLWNPSAGVDEELYETARLSTGAFFNDDGAGGVKPEYSTGVLAIQTEGITITVDGSGTPLQKNVHYEIVNGVLSFKDAGDGVLSSTDTVTINEYYVYTKKHTTETINLTDTNQVETLVETPIAGSINVISVTNGNQVVDPSAYVIAGNTVEFVAGNYDNNETITVSYKYGVTETLTESITVRSIYGGSVYKTATVAITEEIDTATGEVGRRFTFTKPESKKYSNADLPFYFTSFGCPTVGALKQALANYALNNVFEIVTDDDNMATNDFPLVTVTLLDGGDDGVVVTNNQLFEALSGKRDTMGYLIEQGAYQILENYSVDYIYPAGVYADSKQTVNKHSDFHHELALVCAVLTYRTKMTHGFIDVKPNSNTTLVGIQKYVDNLLAYNNTHYMKDADGNEIADTTGTKMDIGWYTSLVVGPEPVMVSDTLGTYYGSPALAYAALCASIKPESAPTNKALPGVKGMKYKFSNKQMNDLIGNRMVVFKLKSEGTGTATSVPYVVDGCTSGAEGSDYARIATVKVVTDVVDQIREVSEPFIGEPNTIEQRNALSALISKRLSYLMEQGEITSYEFEINATIQQVVLGECSISLTLSVPQELRKITTVVALRTTA